MSSKLLARQAGVVLLYFLTAKAGLMFAVVGSTVTLLWPPSGIALAAVLILGYRVSLGIAIGSFLVNATTDVSLVVAAGIAVGNTLEALAGGFLLRRGVDFHLALDRRRDIFALIVLAAVLATALGAAVGSTALTLGGGLAQGDWPAVWLKWWLGDMMGVLVVAPLFLAWAGATRPTLTFQRAIEASVLLLAVLGVSYAIFLSPDLPGHGDYPAALAVFSFVIWGGLRFELWGASLVTLIVSLLAVWGTAQGTGPLIVDSPVDSLLRWCVFANMVAVTGLLLAASSAEERRAKQELEQRVRERTFELARINEDLRQEMTERKRLEGELIRAVENQQRAMGRDLHDGLGQHLTSIAFLGATLQQRLAGLGRAEADAARRIVELVNQAIDMVRALSRGLYPVALETDGLPAALQGLADNTRALKGIDCDFRGDPLIGVADPLVAINLYRIAQEAVNNAVKHSQARRIEIELERQGDHYRLAVSDDGQGFDPAQRAGNSGMGLHNLRYRASLLGGTLSIERTAGGGTTVVVDCPLPE